MPCQSVRGFSGGALRAPQESEYFLKSDDKLLVAEIVAGQEINR